MLYVDYEGNLKGSKDKLKTLFFNSFEVAPFSILSVVGQFSNLHQAMNHLIESTYKVNLTRVSRTEKNKGGDYSSNAYTVTADVNYVGDRNNNENLRSFLTKLYTFKGSSTNFLKTIIKSESKYIDRYYSEDELDSELFSKDYALYQYVPDLMDSPKILQYTPIDIDGLRRGEDFKLDIMDQSIYLSFITKFMEMFGNYIVQSDLVFYSNYEMWLFSVLNKYFYHDLVEDFYKV
jgi:hypothetical protein